MPPQPAAGPTAPLQDELSIFLDDVIHELSSLIDQRPPHEKKTPYSLTSASSSSTATQNLLYALEAENCNTIIFLCVCDHRLTSLRPKGSKANRVFPGR